MKIALVSFGFGEYTVRLASALSPAADVGLWMSGRHGGAYRDQLDPGVIYSEFSLPRMRQPRLQLALMRRLHREIAAFAPDLIHLQQGHLWFNARLRALRRFPLVVTVHDPAPHLGDRPSARTPQFFTDIAFRRADGVIVHNPQMKAEMVRLGIRPEDIHLVDHPALGDPGGGDVAPAGEPTVLFFGRIWPYKGLEYLIRAEPLITASLPDARFIIAGRGEELGRYRAMMVHPERFEIVNEYIPRQAVRALFERAAVVALPYVDATQSGVIPMAYGYGRPVVATAVGGLPSQVDDGRTGLLVPPRDPVALATAIVTVLSDPGLGARLGANAREKARTEWAEETIAADTMAAYRAVLGGRQAK